MLRIHERSSHIRSAHENFRKYVGSHNCLTFASTSYKNCFRYAGVAFTEYINQNALSLTTKLFSLRFFVTVPAVSENALI